MHIGKKFKRSRKLKTTGSTMGRAKRGRDVIIEFTEEKQIDESMREHMCE